MKNNLNMDMTVLNGRYFAYYSLCICVCVCLFLTHYDAEPIHPRTKDIFIGRCWEFQHVINPEAFRGNLKDCDVLWNLFSSAFLYKAPYRSSAFLYNAPYREDFVPFALAAEHPIPTDKALLWEKVFPFVLQYSNRGKRYTTSGDSLLGYMVNELDWCGQLAPPGWSVENCPDFCGVNNTVFWLIYWEQTSMHFAKLARGTVTVLLNGSSSVPYDPNSILARYEIPNLNASEVSDVHALVLHNPNMPVREKCGEGSINSLQEQIKAKDIPFRCTDDPIDILHLLCVDAVDAAPCKQMTSSAVTRIKASSVYVYYVIIHIIGYYTFWLQ